MKAEEVGYRIAQARKKARYDTAGTVRTIARFG